jgi:YD repeat-containing protein
MTRQTPPNPTEGIQYTYDLVGNLTSLADDGGTTAYAYDPVNLVSSVTDPEGRTTTFAHTDGYLRDTVTYPNGVVVDTDWDGSRRMDRMEARAPSGQVLLSRDYSHTSASGADTLLRHSVTTEDGTTTTYGYDTLARLTEATTPGAPDFS